MDGKSLIKHQQKAGSFKDSTGHFCASVYNQFYKYLQKFWSLSLIFCLGPTVQCATPITGLQKTFWSQIRDGVQAAEGLFFPSNNLIFKKLPTLLSSFCIWNSIYKPVSSFMLFLVYAFITHNNRRYCLNNKVRLFIKSLGIRMYVLFLCGHAE